MLFRFVYISVIYTVASFLPFPRSLLLSLPPSSLSLIPPPPLHSSNLCPSPFPPSISHPLPFTHSHTHTHTHTNTHTHKHTHTHTHTHTLTHTCVSLRLPSFSSGPDAGILRTSVLAHVFKGKFFPPAHKSEYIELLGKFEVALALDKRRLLVPSMLPLRPRHTIHAFRNVFPRPSVRQILAKYPNISKLFSPPKPPSPPSSAISTPPHQPSSRSSSTPTGTPVRELQVASHISEELFRSELLLRRFYFMTYVPSGFWPRLISRFLTCTTFLSIVLRALGHSEERVKEEVVQVTTGETGQALGLEWSYWKTGIELWYKGLSLLRVCEILPEGNFHECHPSPSIFEQSRTVPLEPSQATQDLSFELNGQWMPVDMTPNHGIEVVVPDTVCPALLKREWDTVEEERRRREADVRSKGEPLPELERETVWMSAGLLTQAVDFIDTLLEDWYPGLGAREGATTVEAIPYVNRVIPCPFCVSGACVLQPDGMESSLPNTLSTDGTSSDADTPDPFQSHTTPDFNPVTDSLPAHPYRSRAVQLSVLPSPQSKLPTRRTLFLTHTSKALTVQQSPPSPEPSLHRTSPRHTPQRLARTPEIPRARSVSSPFTRSHSTPSSPVHSPPSRKQTPRTVHTHSNRIETTNRSRVHSGDCKAGLGECVTRYIS